MTSDDRRSLDEAISAFAKQRWHPIQLDKNNNGTVSDDLALFVVFWLFENDHYDPVVDLTVSTTTNGAALAMIRDNPGPADWLKDAWLPITLPGQFGQMPKPAGRGQTRTLFQSVQHASPPDGKPLELTRDGPDQVRVPAVISESVRVAGNHARALGLGIARASDYFESDCVTSVRPDEKTWVSSKATIELNAVRRVPDVLKLSRQDAEKTLLLHKFKVGTAKTSKLYDIIVNQTPQGGEFFKIGDTVELVSMAVVPDVVGDLQPVAAKRLTDNGLNWRTTTKVFEIDKVFAQSPLPGSLLGHDEAVALTMRVPVPNVVGRTLANARTTLTHFDLKSLLTTRLAHGQDVVRGQQPQAGEFVSHSSRVTLGPVLGIVPNVQGSSVGKARSQLETDEDYSVRTIGDLADNDVVTGQTPGPGVEPERGTTITLDARVRISKRPRTFSRRG